MSIHHQSRYLSALWCLAKPRGQNHNLSVCPLQHHNDHMQRTLTYNNPSSFDSAMNSPFIHAVAASLQVPTSGHSPLSMGDLCFANIPCPSHQLSQLKLNLVLNPCRLQVGQRINKDSEALNTTSPRIRRHFWLIEFSKRSTQVRTLAYHRNQCWSVTSSFSFQTLLRSQQGTNLLPRLCSTLPCP